MTFEEFWQQTWTPTAQPAVFDLAFKEIARKSWNAAVHSCMSECTNAEDALVMVSTLMSVEG